MPLETGGTVLGLSRDHRTRLRISETPSIHLPETTMLAALPAGPRWRIRPLPLGGRGALAHGAACTERHASTRTRPPTRRFPASNVSPGSKSHSRETIQLPCVLCPPRNTATTCLPFQGTSRKASRLKNVYKTTWFMNFTAFPQDLGKQKKTEQGLGEIPLRQASAVHDRG